MGVEKLAGPDEKKTRAAQLGLPVSTPYASSSHAASPLLVHHNRRARRSTWQSHQFLLRYFLGSLVLHIFAQLITNPP